MSALLHLVPTLDQKNAIMFHDSRTLLKEHGGLISLCFILIFFSVFGQSILFGVYLPMIREEIGLDKTATGAIYALATIASAITIIFSGKILDYAPLRYFVAAVLIGLAIGCFMMSFVTSALTLFITCYLLRHFGQGLMGLSASTSINRYLDENRGKANAISGLGGAIHMMIFPVFALTLNHYINWRDAWIGYGLFCLCVLLPFFWVTLKSHQTNRHALWEKRVQDAEEKHALPDDAVQTAGQHHWTRLEVVTHWRFYALIAVMLFSPFTGTVIFFYQAELAQSLSMSPLAFAASFPFFTAASIGASLVAGSVIDKVGEKSALIVYPIAFALGLYCLTLFEGLFFVYAGMVLVGIGNGIMNVTGGPLISKLYGTKHLGGIKSILFAVNIVGTALSPFLFGYLMDQGVSILTLFLSCAFYASLIWVLAFPICADKKALASK